MPELSASTKLGNDSDVTNKHASLVHPLDSTDASTVKVVATQKHFISLPF